MCSRDKVINLKTRFGGKGGNSSYLQIVKKGFDFQLTVYRLIGEEVRLMSVF